MKSNVKATPYFSAYPLKAVKAAYAETDNKNQSSKKVVGRLRILPMVNPYPAERITSINKIRLPKNIQSPESDWFNNYE